jgi:peptide deformylase
MEQLCLQQQGVGLSAVQVGIPWKLFVVYFDNKITPFRYFVNCRYESNTKKIQSLEGCLSLRNSAGDLRYFEVPRYEKVKIIGQELLIGTNDLEIKDVNFEIAGLYATVFQHEIDHSDQILISEIGKEIHVFG